MLDPEKREEEAACPDGAAPDGEEPGGDPGDDEIPDGGVQADAPFTPNIAFVCTQSRKVLALQLCREVLPLLLEAAHRGAPYVVVRGDVSLRIHTVSSVFSERLFEHGVYGVDSTKGETVIHLVSGSSPVRGTQVNPDYAATLRGLGEEVQSPGDEDVSSLHTRSRLIRMLESA